MASKKLLIITNLEGEIVAAMPEGTKTRAESSATLSPLAGQTLHSVEVPEEILKISMGNKFHSVISDLIVFDEYRKITVKKIISRKKK
jgi:hypothetical protein